MALRADGSVVTWGRTQEVPVDSPVGLSGAMRIASGGCFTAALMMTADCNGNGLRDEREIAADPQVDSDQDGELDSCERAHGDLDLSGSVDAGDVALLLLKFGPCEPDRECIGDIDHSGEVTAADIGAMLLLYGAD